MQSASSVGLYNRTQIAQALVKVKCSITTKALHSYSAGKAAPSADTLIGLKKVLNRSADWLLTGEESQPADVKQLNDLLDRFVAKLGIKEQELDPQLQRVIRIFLKLPSDQKSQLTRLVETYVPKEDT